jgi:hypothetical protein
LEAADKVQPVDSSTDDTVVSVSAGEQWRTQKFSKEGASAAYFSNFTAWLMAIMLCIAVRNMQQKV